MYFENIGEAIGNTPIVKLNRYQKTGRGNIYAKLEYCNPGGSIKDRAALNMINEMEEEGKIFPGDTLIEATSGNTGIGLAMIGASKGYKVVIVMPENMTEERIKLMKAYGAEVILTKAEKRMAGAIEVAEGLVKEKGYKMISQFENQGNPNAHLLVTAREIIWDMPKLEGFVAGVGTGGTITGCSQLLKQTFPDVKIVAVEPDESAVLSGEQPGKHGIQGIGAGFIPKILDTEIIDKVIRITTEEAYENARECAKKEGLLIGISSGAALAAAIKLADELGEGKDILFIAPDSGERYLSTDLY